MWPIVSDYKSFLSFERRSMDHLDRKLIAILEEKGFQKSTEMFQILGISDRTIRLRINKMIQENVIKVIAIPNPLLLGYRDWARIGIRVAPGFLSRVAHELVQFPSVYFAATTVGRFDIMISVYFDSFAKLTNFVNLELTKVRGILFTEPMLLVYPRKYQQFSWPSPDFMSSDEMLESHHGATLGHSHYKMDEVDRRIFNVLIEDGLQRPKSLKSRLGIGETTIRKRLKAMLQNQAYKLEVVPIISGFEHEAVATIGITINRPCPHKILDSLIEHPNVILASVAFGRFNLIVVTRFGNTNLLTNFVSTVLPSIPGISSVEYYLHVKRLKYYSISWPIS